MRRETFERLGLVEDRRRGAIAVVDGDRDLGMIARRALGVAGEDDVVHLGRAHGLVRGLAHDPAHRLDQVGLAATVRPDHAGQTGFDLKVGRFDEGLEADQAQPRELHAGIKSIPLSAAAKGIILGSRRVHTSAGAWNRAASARRMNRRVRKRNRVAALSRPSPWPAFRQDRPAGRRGTPGGAKNPYPSLR
jgi:hypothetical protein